MMTAPGRERGKRYNTVHRSRKEDCRHPQHKRKNQIKNFGVHNAAFGQVVAQPKLLNSSPRCRSEITVDFFGIVSELHQTFLKHANIVSDVAVFNNIFGRCIRIQQTEKSLICLTTLCQMIRTLEKFNGLFERFVKNIRRFIGRQIPKQHKSLLHIAYMFVTISEFVYLARNYFVFALIHRTRIVWCRRCRHRIEKRKGIVGTCSRVRQSRNIKIPIICIYKNK